MKKNIPISIMIYLFFSVTVASAQVPEKGSAPSANGEKAAAEKLSKTRHVIVLDNGPVEYLATAGRLHVRNHAGKHEADIFFIAYTKEPGPKEPGTGPTRRPLTFAFNGGPGASSVWLNFGAFGPKRVFLPDEGGPPPPPYQLVDNACSLLDVTDLVFIDPVGTGYSRAAEGVKEKTFFDMETDVAVLGAFIRAYVTRFGRWESPKFLAGESYGGMRALLLARHLHERYGLDCNGLILISPALNFQNFVFGPDNFLPYVLFLPAYTAAAFYHKKLAPPLSSDLRKTLAEVEAWTMNGYLPALARGDALKEAEEKEVMEKLHTYTGLSEDYIKEARLRITNRAFSRELLRSQGLIVGILDSRLTASDRGWTKPFIDEPGMVLTVGPYVGALNDHLGRDLRYQSDLPYRYFSQEASATWNWGSAIQGYPAATDTLAALLRQFGYFRVFIAGGYYDLDIGYYASRYAVDHLGLPRDLKDHITLRYYESGHQIYVHLPSLIRLKGDVAAFIKAALTGK